MDNNYTQFIIDVNERLTDYDTEIINNEILVKNNSKTLLINRTVLYKYYNTLKNSSVLYSEWISRTSGYIIQLINKWLNT